MIFFWRRTTEVHFFSRRPEYLAVVESSNWVAGRDSSVRRVEAEVGRLAVVR